jgi:hypothetical protein
MTITITAFERSPDRGRGLARDVRIRWALEEVNQPYDVRLLSFSAMKEPAHLALHPFGRIPTYEARNSPCRRRISGPRRVIPPVAWVRMPKQSWLPHSSRSIALSQPPFIARRGLGRLGAGRARRRCG